MNAAANAVAILACLFFTIAFIISYTVLNSMYKNTQSAMNSAGFDISAPYANMYPTYKDYFLDAWQFFLYLTLSLIFMSSFINAGDFRSYVLAAVASIIACVVCSHIGAQVWNVISANPALDFTDFPSDKLWFVSNLSNIFIVNVLCGLLSFVFAKRGVQTVTYG